MGIIVLVILIASTYGLLTQSESSEEKVKLVLTNKVGFEPMFYGIENEKAPEPEGVDVEIVTAKMTQAELYTLSTESPIIGILSNINVGRARNKGMNYTIIAPYYREGLGPGNETVGKLVTDKDSSIEKPSDLYGKKVGIQGKYDGSTIAMMTAMREKYGLNLSKIDFIAAEVNTAPILVRQGELAAAMFDSDFILKEDYNEKYRTVMDFGKDLHELYGSVPPAKFLVVRSKHYREDPEIYDKAVEYLRRNYQWSMEHKESVARAHANRTGEDYAFLIKKYGYFSRLGELTEQDVDVYREFYETAKKRGAIEKVPDLKRLFDIKNT